MKRTGRGAAIGFMAGLVVGALGELAVFIVRVMFPTDVAIVGFALMWAIPLGTIVGAVGGWRNWNSNDRRLAIAASVVAVMAAVFAVMIQLWSV